MSGWEAFCLFVIVMVSVILGLSELYLKLQFDEAKAKLETRLAIAEQRIRQFERNAIPRAYHEPRTAHMQQSERELARAVRESMDHVTGWK